jgi:hypothetical protein
MSLVKINGNGTIVWGTGGVANTPNGAIIESIALTAKNGEPIEIEDNSGLGAFQVMLRDGFNAKTSAMYDASKSWPIEGSNMGLAIPFAGASANAIPFGEPAAANGGSASYASGVVTYTVLVAAPPEITLTKKKEMMINYSLTYRPNITV